MALPSSSSTAPSASTSKVFGHALLIGCQTFGLAGVHSDVDDMTESLRSRGFLVDQRIGEDATRAGIFDGLEALMRRSSDSHAAVIYYSGHGGLIRSTDARGQPTALPFIVPTDYSNDDSREFDGILGLELSLTLLDLLQRTRNVTVILDCCHSGRMVRDATLFPKSLPTPSTARVERALARLRARGGPIEQLHVESHPEVVRVVAANEGQHAFEIREGNDAKGLLTSVLVETLDASRDTALSWAVLGARIRDAVLRRAPSQRPEVEGPARRVPFSTRTSTTPSSFSISTDERGRATVQAGALLDVTVGDEFMVVDEHPARSAPRRTGARVIEVRPLDALVELDGPLPTSARAIRTRRAAPRNPVVVSAPEPIRSRLRTALADAPLLEAMDSHPMPLATVTVEDRRVSVQTSAGDVIAPALWAPDRVPELVRAVEQLAGADVLRRLCRDAPTHPHQIRVELGRVERSPARRSPLPREVVHPSEAVYLRVDNTSQRTQYVHAFDIGISGAVTLLTTSSPSGIELPPGRTYTLGARDGHLRGMQLYWPEGVPMDAARSEEFIVVATTKPIDLRPLEALGTASSDAIAREGRLEPSEGFGAARVEFTLAPWLCEDRPTKRAVPPRSAAPRAGRLTLALSECHVHVPRGVFEHATRLDVLVVLQGPRGPALHTFTHRSANPPAHHPLIASALLYDGPAGDVVDVHVWASRAAPDARPLCELLAGIEPTMSSSDLARTAYDRLLGTSGLAVGLYRASLQASHAYSVTGNTQWLRRAGDCSFVFDVNPRGRR